MWPVTRTQAVEEVAYGIQEWIDYFRSVVAPPLAPQEPDPHKRPQALVAAGTADDAAAQLERLKNQSEGVGCFLIILETARREAPYRPSRDTLQRAVPSQDGNP